MKKPVRKQLVRKRRGYQSGGMVEDATTRLEDEPEKLPGITSGPPGKPWGLDRDQPRYKAPDWTSGLKRFESANTDIDRKGELRRTADVRSGMRLGLGTADAARKNNAPRVNPFPGSYTADNPDESYAKGGKVRSVRKPVRKRK